MDYNIKPKFWKSPVNWFASYIMRSNLPLLWKARVATWNMEWWSYKRHFKNQLLGELIVIVVSIDKDWEMVQGKYSQTRVRDVTYRWKRSKLPFVYRKSFQGTQCTDESAHPLGRIPHSAVASINDKVYEYNLDVRVSNKRHEHHQNLKASIIGHQYQEYDHDRK